jgi:PAS domain S-box-containing protein
VARAEHRWRTALDGAADYVVLIAPDGTIRHLNRSGFGYSMDDIVGKRRIYDFLDSSNETRVRDAVDRAIATGETQSFETHVGQVDRWFLAHAAPLADGDRSDGLLLVARDITELKRADEHLRESEARFRAMVQHAPETIALMDLDKGHFVDCNEHCLKLFGYERERFLELGIPEISSPRQPDGRTTDEVIAELLPRLARSEEVVFEWIHRKATGEDFPSETRLVMLPGTGQRLLRGSVVDISERKRTENELRSTGERLRRLASGLQAVREEERTRISREIHDELGQQLTSLRLDLSWLQGKLVNAEVELLQRCRSMLSLTDAALDSMHRIASRLRPPMLDDLGLEAAIEWQGREFSAHTGCACDLELEVGETNLDPGAQTAVFRVLQEALTNVARHAEANHVEVLLERDGSHLVLRVSDDGKGISEEDLTRAGSLGLLGMHEWATSLGGEVLVQPGPETGTMVSLRIPLQS